MELAVEAQTRAHAKTDALSMLRLDLDLLFCLLLSIAASQHNQRQHHARHLVAQRRIEELLFEQWCNATPDAAGFGNCLQLPVPGW
jgi:hypothetical protein